MLYQVSHGSKYFGADAVFEDVQFEIKSNEKITIVGRNGCGKTTFLRCMCGEYAFDRGNVSMVNGTTIGYLAQKVLEDDGSTVEQELMKVFAPVFALQRQMQEMVRMILKLEDIIRPDDAADAVAAALTHLQAGRMKEQFLMK